MRERLASLVARSAVAGKEPNQTLLLNDRFDHSASAIGGLVTCGSASPRSADIRRSVSGVLIDAPCSACFNSQRPAGLLTIDNRRGSDRREPKSSTIAPIGTAPAASRNNFHLAWFPPRQFESEPTAFTDAQISLDREERYLPAQGMFAWGYGVSDADL